VAVLVAVIRKTAGQAVVVAAEPILPMAGLVLQTKDLPEETIKAAVVAQVRLVIPMEPAMAAMVLPHQSPGHQ